MNTDLADQKISNKKQPNLVPSKQKQVERLESLIEKLNFICSNLDPYNPIPSTMREMIKELDIVKIDDPFTLTNQLVVLLEDAVEELHSLDSKNE